MNTTTEQTKDQILRLLDEENLTEARPLCQAWLARSDTADAWRILGVIAGREGKLPEAERCFREAVARNPADTKALSNLAHALRAQGKLAEAANAFRSVLSLEDNAQLRFVLADVLTDLGELAAAEVEFRNGLAAKPEDIPARYSLGWVCQQQGRLKEARDCYEQVLARDPQHAHAMNNLGLLLLADEEYDEARGLFERVITLQPDFAPAWRNLGKALIALGHLNNAVTTLKRSMQLGNDAAEAWNDIGQIRVHQGRYKEASEHFKQALSLAPGDAYANSALASILLLHGEFHEAWQHYYYRLPSRPGQQVAPLPQDMHGKRILLRPNQGLGDELFFLRFTPQLKARGAWIIYLPSPKIYSLAARLASVDRVVNKGEVFENIAFRFSVDTLPLLLGMDDVSKIPPSLSLVPLPESVEAVHGRLRTAGPGPYIGVTWRAGTKNKSDALSKECPKEHIAQVLRPLSATVLILQRQPQTGEIEAFSEALGRPVHDYSDLNDHLENMLALLSLVDDYVGVSNTNMHLMAALGKTARVLVPTPPDWRWMAEGKESPWFPGFSIYRQGYDRDWGRALDDLRRDLRQSLTAP